MIKSQNTHRRGLGRAAHTLLRERPRSCVQHHGLRSYHATFPFASGEPNQISRKQKQRAERDQLIKSLKESPGSRDAKNFLKHFDPPKTTETVVSPQVQHDASQAVQRAHRDDWRLFRTGVNLGNLYEPTKAAQDSPVFARQPQPEKRPTDTVEPLHVALVKLRQPQLLDDETLGGLALTLGQMVRLGLNIALVVDCDEHIAIDGSAPSPTWREMVQEQSARIVEALEEFSEPGAFEVDHALSYVNVDAQAPTSFSVEVKDGRLLSLPIEDGIIPVIPPIAYDVELKKVRVQPDHVVLALTREFAGLTKQHTGKDEQRDQGNTALQHPKPAAVLDRIIILDPLGGIPSENRADGTHVFINLAAEYKDVREILRGMLSATITNGRSSDSSLLEYSSATSMSAESKVTQPLDSSVRSPTTGSIFDRHSMNLDVVHKSLNLLPPSSSALIITPVEAAISSQAPSALMPSPGVRTRRSKNPLIHNLLTDKPMVSSSLPAPLVTRHVGSTAPNLPTFLKKGIPVTLIPDPLTRGPWRPPSSSNPSIELESDPRINFPKLVDLIEDSFRRKLDTRHYLDRIRGKVAGIIIAGDYEGGAICTWETPSQVTGQLVPDSPMWIPYLDKFAVLTSSQGSGGVADIVWGALTRTCFPDGLVWRSRTSNPVNKWYFERAVGMWNLPDDQWTMFWTTEGVTEEWAERQGRGQSGEAQDMTKWDAYVNVCGGVLPSWADGKRPD
jgi:amino-acid N-acetyltransferase